MMKYIIVTFLVFASCERNQVIHLKEPAGKTIFRRSTGHKIAFGAIDHGIKYGKWEYYDAQGHVVQTGDYNSGLITGVWKYDYTQFEDSLIIWQEKRVLLNKANLSLPTSFKDQFSNQDEYMAVDTLTGDVFSLQVFYNNKYISLNALSESVILGLVANGDSVLSQSPSLVESDGGEYLLNRIETYNNTLQKGKLVSIIHKKIGEQYLVWSYSCSIDDAVKVFLFLGEIFHHTFYKGELIQESFGEISIVKGYSD